MAISLHISARQIEWYRTLAEAQKAAKKSHKPILVDCFVNWAGGSVLMDSVVLRDPLLTEWIPAHFEPLHLNMREGEGLEVAQRYKVESYAYFLVLDKNAEVVHRISGGMPAAEFKERLAEALSPRTSLQGTRLRIEKGKGTTADTVAYLRALRVAGDGDMFRRVGEGFALRQAPECYLRPDYWAFAGLAMHGSAEHFNYLLRNRDAFVKTHGERKVNDMFESVLCRQLVPWAEGRAQKHQKNAVLDSLLLLVEASCLPDTTPTVLMADVARLRTAGEYAAVRQVMAERGHVLDRYRGVRASLERTLVFETQDSTMVEQSGVQFADITFDAALQKAAAENKLVFMDCQTVWCGPCRAMAQRVFPLAEVGGYMNSRFVSLKMDMESGEGPALSRRYGIKAYPTMLILNDKGEELHRIVGYKNAEMLLNELRSKIVRK